MRSLEKVAITNDSSAHPVAGEFLSRRTGRTKGLTILVIAMMSIVAVAVVGCTVSEQKRNSSQVGFADMLRVAKAAEPRIAQSLREGKYGPLPLQNAADGARMGQPVPERTAQLGVSIKRPLLSQLESTVREYEIPILNDNDERIGEFSVALSDGRWQVLSAGREGVLARASQADTILKVLPSQATLVAVPWAGADGKLPGNTVWSVVASGGVEWGVAPFIDPYEYKVWPKRGQAYAGVALRLWFTRRYHN